MAKYTGRRVSNKYNDLAGSSSTEFEFLQSPYQEATAAAAAAITNNHYSSNGRVGSSESRWEVKDNKSRGGGSNNNYYHHTSSFSSPYQNAPSDTSSINSGHPTPKYQYFSADYTQASTLYTNNHNSSLGHHQPVLLMTPPLLSKNKTSSSGDGDGGGGRRQQRSNDSNSETSSMFEDFDGVHINDDDTGGKRDVHCTTSENAVVSSSAYQNLVTQPTSDNTNTAKNSSFVGNGFDFECQQQQTTPLNMSRTTTATSTAGRGEGEGQSEQSEEVIHTETTLYHPKPQRLVNKEAFEESQMLSIGGSSIEVAEPPSSQYVDDDEQHEEEEKGGHKEEANTRPRNNFNYYDDEDEDDAYGSSSEILDEVRSFNLSSLINVPLDEDLPQPPEYSPEEADSIQQSDVGGDREVSFGSLHGSMDTSHASSLDNVLNRRVSQSSSSSSKEQVPHDPHMVARDENGDPLVYYPAPIPIQLRLPPLLSKKNRQSSGSNNHEAKSRQTSQETSSSDHRIYHNDQSHIKPNRASAILSPPDWTIGMDNNSEQLRQEDEVEEEEEHSDYYYDDDDYAQHSSRPASPASSMDSGMATIESDDEDGRNLDDEVVLKQGPTKNDGRSPSRSKDSSASKRKSFLNFNKLLSHKKDSKKKNGDHDDINEDGEWALAGVAADVDGEDDEDSSTKNVDHLAFTHYNPGKVQATTENFALGANGILPGADNKPASLIEELELKKAGRKARSHMYQYDGRYNNNTNYGAVASDDTKSMTESAKRLSVPVLQDKRRTLLQLEKMARNDYDSQLAYTNHARTSRGELPTSRSQQQIQSSASSFGTVDQDETLGARRAKLKMLQREQQQASQEETLNISRARVRESRRQSSVATNEVAPTDPSEETLAQRKARLRRQQKSPSLTKGIQV